ncbi:hypothetical protein [Yoonia sp.]|uniref:hypothetical protein n=1 Tax=Yoonia sp. TaxID=2212373 RepID=UPI0025FB9A53|nr:hypothetical protein [Yoonia sp.]
MKTLISVLFAAVIGSGASAQDFYAGATLDYGLPHSGDAQTVGSVIAGVGLGDAQIGYGAEVELGMHVAGDADYDTQRFRFWGTYGLGDISARVAGGVTQFDTDSGIVDGYNLGLGVQRDVSDRLTMRGEFIRDFPDDSAFPAVTTTRIGVTYKF